MLGDVQIPIMSNLTVMKNLSLVRPWVRPLLDQEFGRATTVGLGEIVRDLCLLARLK